MPPQMYPVQPQQQMYPVQQPPQMYPGQQQMYPVQQPQQMYPGSQSQQMYPVQPQQQMYPVQQPQQMYPVQSQQPWQYPPQTQPRQIYRQQQLPPGSPMPPPIYPRQQQQLPQSPPPSGIFQRAKSFVQPQPSPIPQIQKRDVIPPKKSVDSASFFARKQEAVSTAPVLPQTMETNVESIETFEPTESPSFDTSVYENPLPTYNVATDVSLPPMSNVVTKDYKKNFPVGKTKILFFGETGSGKSTLVNTLTNYFEDGTIDNLKVSIPTAHIDTKNTNHTERNRGKTSEAQTDKATEYSFTVDKSVFTIIDTPGLNDTQGLGQDDENMKIIMEAAINATELSAIVLVINGTNARATQNIKSMLNKFKGSLPDSIMNNIVVIFTMCREDTCNFTDLDILGIKPAKIFYMNNTAFSQDPKRVVNKDIMNFEWNLSMATSDTLMKHLTSMGTVSTEEFTKIRDIRNNIKSKLHETRLKITRIQTVLEEYHTALKDKEKFEASEEEFKDYTVQKQVVQEQLVESPYHSTICGKCSKVCHDNCGLEEISVRGSHDFTGCAAFAGQNTCIVCGCHYETHYHDRKTMSVVTVTLDEELQEIKDKYLAAQKAKGDAIKQMTDSDLVKASISNEVETAKKDIADLCVDLKKICSNYNMVNELTDMIYQMKQEAESLTSVEARQTANDFIKTIEIMSDEFAKLDAANKKADPKGGKRSIWSTIFGN